MLVQCIFTLTAISVIGFAKSANTSLSQADTIKTTQVLSKIHAANEMEMQMGELAKEKGHNTQVKIYGDRLYRDHFAADQQVVAFAHSKGIVLSEPKPTTVTEAQHDNEDKATMTQLQNLTGDAFDETFVQSMKKGHSETIHMLTSAENELADKDAQGLIKKLLPILKEHYTLAEHLDQKITSRKDFP